MKDALYELWDFLVVATMVVAVLAVRALPFVFIAFLIYALVRSH